MINGVRHTKGPLTVALMLLGLGGGTARAATASFGPMPTIPTPEQCREMNLADNQVVSGFLQTSQADEAAQFGNIYNGDRLRFQDQNTAEWLRLGHEASARYTQCLREAQAAQQAGGGSESIGSGVVSAWLSGIGALPGSAFSASSPGGLTGLTELAAQTVKSEQQFESWNLRLGAAQTLITSLLSGGSPSADPQTRVWQAVSLANDLHSEVAPPWSVLATSLAVNAIRAISQDTMSQLDNAMSEFDAVASSDSVSGSIDTTVRSYLAQGTPPVGGPAANPTLDALNTLDDVVQRMTELAQDVSRQVATERQAEANRRLAEERASQRQVGASAPQATVPSPGYSPAYAPPTAPACDQREAIAQVQAMQQAASGGACSSFQTTVQVLQTLISFAQRCAPSQVNQYYSQLQQAQQGVNMACQ